MSAADLIARLDLISMISAGMDDDGSVEVDIAVVRQLRDALFTAIQERDRARADAFDRAIVLAEYHAGTARLAMADGMDGQSGLRVKEATATAIVADLRRARASLSQEPGRSEAMDGEGGR